MRGTTLTESGLVVRSLLPPCPKLPTLSFLICFLSMLILSLRSNLPSSLLATKAFFSTAAGDFLKPDSSLSHLFYQAMPPLHQVFTYFLPSHVAQAAASPLGVIGGALAGHGVAILLAVSEGSLLGTFLSERAIAYICGTLFLIFAPVTLIEIVN